MSQRFPVPNNTIKSALIALIPQNKSAFVAHSFETIARRAFQKPHACKSFPASNNNVLSDILFALRVIQLTELHVRVRAQWTAANLPEPRRQLAALKQLR